MIIDGSKSKTKKSYPKPPELEKGTYNAYLFGIIRKGEQIKWDGDPITDTVTLVFEVVDEFVMSPARDSKEGDPLVERPRIIFYEAKVSGHRESNLVKFIRAVADLSSEVILSEKEANVKFNLEKAIGVPVSIGVVHSKKGRAEIKTFSTVSTKQASNLPGLISEPFCFNPYASELFSTGSVDVFYTGMLKQIAEAVDHHKFSPECIKLMTDYGVEKFGTIKTPGVKEAYNPDQTKPQTAQKPKSSLTEKPKVSKPEAKAKPAYTPPPRPQDDDLDDDIPF